MATIIFIFDLYGDNGFQHTRHTLTHRVLRHSLLKKMIDSVDLLKDLDGFSLLPHLQEVPRTLREKKVEEGSQNGGQGGDNEEQPPATKLDGAKGGLNVPLGYDQPGKGTAQQPTKHPKRGLHSKVGAAVLVANELRVVGEENRQ